MKQKGRIVINLVGITAAELYDLIKPEGFNISHAVSITNSLYKKRIADLSLIKGIPKRLSFLLSTFAKISIFDPQERQISYDGSVKYLFRNKSGQLFETVCIPDGKRITVCVSTQSGCRMGCPFCVTAKYGFHGNLDTGDIINQVLAIEEAPFITNVVFMGMGEPLDNAENVFKACEILSAEWGLALGARNITVSTVGITPAVMQFLERTQCNLALSLFSPFREERLKVIPAESKYPSSDIIEIMKSFPLKKKRRLSIAYVMISGVNDTDRHLSGLRDLLKYTGIRVNLLPYHRVPDDKYMSSSNEKMSHFKHSLITNGISASVRKSRGSDISAACGLLASGLTPGK